MEPRPADPLRVGAWGGSITFTFRDKPNDPFWSAPETGSPHSNPFGLDIIVNVMSWSTGKRLPQDPLKVHEYRRLVFDYGIQRSLLISLLEFAEAFGANSTRIYAGSNAIGEERRRSEDLYLDRDFDAGLDTMETAFGSLVELQASAMQLKSKALFWIYLAEWMVTMCTFIIPDAVLWSLMVRRTLHREIPFIRWSA